MQVSIEESGVIERKLRVSVPHAEVDRAIEQRLRSVAANARIPGFRPGKAPREMIARRYGEQVTREVVSDTIESSYREALGREEIVPAGLLSIEPKPFVAGDDLQYVATIELFPEIPSPTLAGRRFEKPVCEISADDIDRTLQSIRERSADYTAKNGKAARGDRLCIDFHGRIDGESFEGGDAEEHRFILGEGHAIAEFDQLTGVRAGDTREVTHAFADDYPQKEIAGKRVQFAVTVRAVESPKLPELNAAFAEKFGVKEGGMAKVREEIALSLRREVRTKMRGVLRARVMRALLEANPVTAPKALVESETARRMRELESRIKAAGASMPGFDADAIDRAQIEQSAQRSVLLSLIAEEVIKREKLQPDAKVTEELLEELARDYDHPQQFIEWQRSDASRMRRIEEMALEQQMVARMIESADVAEKQVSFRDFMALQE